MFPFGECISKSPAAVTKIPNKTVAQITKKLIYCSCSMSAMNGPHLSSSSAPRCHSGYSLLPSCCSVITQGTGIICTAEVGLSPGKEKECKTS